MSKTLIILRGLPGCGKTTLANIIAKPRYVCSADDYFMKNGKYKFDASQLHNAHGWCKEKCKNLMYNNTELIVVANTNTTLKEFKPYMELAKEYGYMCFVTTVENYNNTVNVHSVPDNIIDKMKNRFTLKLI